MKTFLAVYGALHILALVMGSVNVIDYHVCIKGPGDCGPHEVQEKW